MPVKKHGKPKANPNGKGRDSNKAKSKSKVMFNVNTGQELTSNSSTAAAARASPAAFVRKEDFHLGKGMLVRAAYKKGKKYFRGVVHRVNDNGTYDVMYNGGELEFKVERRFIDAVETRAEWKQRLHLRAVEEKKAQAMVESALGRGGGNGGGGGAGGAFDVKKIRSQSDAPFDRNAPLRTNLPWNCSVCRKPNNGTSENCRVCGTSKYYELSISKERIAYVLFAMLLVHACMPRKVGCCVRGKVFRCAFRSPSFGWLVGRPTQFCASILTCAGSSERIECRFTA